METFPVLPHPLPPQEQEEFGLAVYTAVVSGAHGAAFTDGVRSIASCGRNTRCQQDGNDPKLVILSILSHCLMSVFSVYCEDFTTKYKKLPNTR